MKHFQKLTIGEDDLIHAVCTDGTSIPVIEAAFHIDGVTALSCHPIDDRFLDCTTEELERMIENNEERAMAVIHYAVVALGQTMRRIAGLLSPKHRKMLQDKYYKKAERLLK